MKKASCKASKVIGAIVGILIVTLVVAHVAFRPPSLEGRTVSQAAIGGTEIRHRTEPGTSVFSRLLLWFFGLLPIEWLL